MEKKYYKPEIEDIRVGYECEILSNHHTSKGEIAETVWSSYIFTPMTIETGNIKIKDVLGMIFEVRTPYLTKEQIEAEGWTAENLTGSFSKQIGEYTFFIRKRSIDDIEIVKIKTIENGVKNSYRTIFNGKCPSINEFRYIIKLLNIK